MIHFSLKNVKKIVSTLSLSAMVAVLLVQAPVQAQSTAMATNELKTLVNNVKKEVDRRLASTNEGIKSVEASTLISGDEKKTILTALKTSRTGLMDFKKQIESATTMEAAREIASKVDSQYEQYATANATAYTLKDGDAQQQTAKQLESLADDAQSKIDEAGANDQDVGGLQEQLKGIDQLIESISAVIASVVALLIALATGNFSEAATIFQTILGQLGLNITSIDSAQTGLGSIIDIAGGFSFGSLGSQDK